MITRARARAQENRRRLLILFLRIPNETWTDVLKLFSRRTLVQKISPVCYRLNEISNKNVKTVHVIKNEHRFTDKLKKGDPEANRQLEHLAANKCGLADQFRMTWFRVPDEKSKIVLRHSLDLMRGCQLSFNTHEQSASGKLVLLDECLTLLESKKPITIAIEIDQDKSQDPDGTFWLHPTVQKCSRVEFNLWNDLSNANMIRISMAISHWLHHRPMDRNCFAADQQQIRCMIVWCAYTNHLNWLLDRCSNNIQQSCGPTDRRQYVLSFSFDPERPEWTGFGKFRRIENKLTGEVLVLDRVVLIYADLGRPTPNYRLRRCLAEEEANGKEVYAEMFTVRQENGFDAFNIGDEEEDNTPSVIIG